MAFLLPLDSGREGEDVGILNKGKPKHGRLHRRVGVTLSALVAAVSMAFAPAAMADMQGVDVSNWQCGIDIANTQADFVVDRHHMGHRAGRTTTVSCPASTRTPTA